MISAASTPSTNSRASNHRPPTRRIRAPRLGHLHRESAGECFQVYDSQFLHRRKQGSLKQHQRRMVAQHVWVLVGGCQKSNINIPSTLNTCLEMCGSPTHPTLRADGAGMTVRTFLGSESRDSSASTVSVSPEGRTPFIDEFHHPPSAELGRGPLFSAMDYTRSMRPRCHPICRAPPSPYTSDMERSRQPLTEDSTVY